MGKSSPNIERPVLAVDVVVLQLRQARLHVLLHRRRVGPFAGKLGLPGVAANVDETLEQAARRALTDKAGLSVDAVNALFVEQLATFDALYRDPRGRTVSVAYLALTRREEAGIWEPCDAGGQGLPFDHDQILELAIRRLRGKLRYTDIAAWLVPATFQIGELHGAYEAILGRELNRSNFRNKLLKVGLIERVGIDAGGVGKKGGRPPHIYRFRAQDRDDQRDFL